MNRFFKDFINHMEQKKEYEECILTKSKAIKEQKK